MNQQTTSILDIIARILMATLFIYSGFGKLMDPSTVATRLAGAGFPLPTLSAYAAIAIEFGAAATLIAGYRLVVTCAVLAVFTVLATGMFHQFWTFEGPQRTGQTFQFLKNACILAGLWFIVRVTLLEGLRNANAAVAASRAPAE